MRKFLFVVLTLILTSCTAYDELQMYTPGSSEKKMKGTQKKPATPVYKRLAVR